METVVSEFEELMLCGYCKQKFNETDQSPKLLSCKHYFCLQCMRTNLNKGQELYCVHCWKRTELGDMGPESLPTYTPVLCLTKNFSQMKLNAKPVEKQSKVISENCHTHAMPLALWCHTCCSSVCRACATTSDHTNHQIKSQNEAKEHLITELQIDLASMNKMLAEIQRLAMQQREFLLKILEACVTLKTHVEADLTNNVSHVELTETRDILAKMRMNLSMVDNLSDVHNLYSTLNMEKQRLQMRYQEMYLQCQLDDLVRNSTVVFDFQMLKQTLNNIHSGDIPFPGNSRILPPSQQNPILFLANYCMSQLYSRHVIAKQAVNGNMDYHNHNTIPPLPSNYLTPSHAPPHLVLTAPKNLYQDNSVVMQNMMHSPQIGRNPVSVCPLYYFNIEVNGAPMGRIVIEVNLLVFDKNIFHKPTFLWSIIRIYLEISTLVSTLFLNLWKNWQNLKHYTF